MVKVLIAHQSYLVSDSLRSILRDQEDIHVVGCATHLEQLHFLAPQSDVILLSFQFDGRNTTHTVRTLRKRGNKTRVIVTNVPDDPSSIVRFVEAGAVGYILDGETASDVPSKIRAAADGRALVSAKVAAAMIRHVNKLARSTPVQYREKCGQIETLTSRQREVVALISRGLTNQEIACALTIACGTVKNHVHHILKKIGATNRHEAAHIYQTYHRAAGGALYSGSLQGAV